MVSAWISNGPISLPSRTLACGAGAVIVAFALFGTSLGFQMAVRRNTAPEMGVAGAGGTHDDALIARPIVDLAPPTAAPTEGKDDNGDDDADKADALAAQTAAAQAIQAKPSAAGGNIDDVLASPTEKPPTATKGGADEAPPGTPVKSDVPF